MKLKARLYPRSDEVDRKCGNPNKIICIWMLSYFETVSHFLNKQKRISLRYFLDLLEPSDQNAQTAYFSSKYVSTPLSFISIMHVCKNKTKKKLEQLL